MTCCALVLRTAMSPAILAGQLAVRSTGMQYLVSLIPV